MRVKYQRAPITTEWTVGAKANTGDGILAAEKLGAALDIMEDAWWGPTVPLVGAPWFALSERNSPGSIIVNTGRQAVHERVDALRRGVPPHVRRHVRPGPGTRRERPGLAGVRPAVPRSLHLRGTATGTTDSEASGWSPASSSRPTRSRSWREKTGLPVDALTATVERFNGFARSGVDEDFHRGESAYDRYYGDPTNKPNPNLGEINHGAVLRGQDGARRPGHQGRHPHRRARPRAARRRLDDRGPLCRRQCQRTGDGPHLSRPRRDDRPGHDVRIPGGAAHRREETDMPINLDEAHRRRAGARRILLDQ